MAIAPFTAGSAVMHLDAVGRGVTASWWTLAGGTMGALGPLFCALFCGFMGREVFMDLRDYDGDKKAGIETVPVRYGRRFGAGVGFGFYGLMSLVAVLGPMVEVIGSMGTRLGGLSVVQLLRVPAIQRLLCGSLAGILMGRRGYQIYRTEGRDEDILEKAIEEGKFTSLLILASFVKL